MFCRACRERVPRHRNALPETSTQNACLNLLFHVNTQLQQSSDLPFVSICRRSVVSRYQSRPSRKLGDCLSIRTPMCSPPYIATQAMPYEMANRALTRMHNKAQLAKIQRKIQGSHQCCRYTFHLYLVRFSLWSQTPICNPPINSPQAHNSGSTTVSREIYSQRATSFSNST